MITRTSVQGRASSIAIREATLSCSLFPGRVERKAANGPADVRINCEPWNRRA
jgi:hypothetical protein